MSDQGWRAALGVGSPVLTERWFWRLVAAIGITVVMQVVGYALGGVAGLLVGVFGSIFFAILLMMAVIFVFYTRPTWPSGPRSSSAARRSCWAAACATRPSSGVTRHAGPGR